ncbi:MAG TPA: GrpB family protein [Gaiellaceae bacterium]|nr:GrpB family protein [Gaiellaceae bacterium]
MDPKPAIYLISGPMAAGKSTVARALAERFERSVHLEGDLFRRSVVRGRVEMTPDASAEALGQLQLRYRLATTAADAYLDAGFTVALEDVFAPEQLGELRTSIRGRPCHVIVLLPSPEALAERDGERAAKAYRAWTVEQLHAVFAEAAFRVGIWLDTSTLRVEETVDRILAETSSERSPIVVADYDPAWPALFEHFAEPLRVALPGASVEHVGSTAVPGLAAKPIVDLDVVVGSPDDVPGAIEALAGLGYVYQGDKGVPGREAFLWPASSEPHHVYVVVAGSEPYRDHVNFRDRLLADPATAREYSALKRELAERFGDNRIGYTEEKSEFVASVLAAARSVGRA